MSLTKYMAIRLFETLTQRLVVVDFEYILVQSCSVVVDLVHTLILSSVVMNLIRHLTLRNWLVNQILHVFHPRGIFFLIAYLKASSTSNSSSSRSRFAVAYIFLCKGSFFITLDALRK